MREGRPDASDPLERHRRERRLPRQPRRPSRADRGIPRARGQSQDASGRADGKFRQRGQLPPRERVNWLLDRDSPFLELSSLCGLGMHEDDGADNVFGGGSIVGIGLVSGARCMIAANNSGIKGGAAHPMGVEKAIRAQEIALINKLPYVQLVESAGANLHAAGGDVRPRRRDLRQHGAPVGGGHPRRFDRARLLDRRRRLSDRPCRLCRHGARPLESLPRRAAAAQGRDRRDRRRRGARRGGAAYSHDRARRISRRGRCRRVAHRPGNSGADRLAGDGAAAESAAAALRPGGAARDRSGRLPQAL